MTDSTNIAFDFVNEIVNSSFESTQKPTIPVVVYTRAHSKKWTEKFPWLIVNNIREQTTPSSKICQEQRDTLKF